MSHNTSATGGYLLPDATILGQHDRALERVLQQMVAGVTGLPGELVRPRWQPEPPHIPVPGVSWIALGIESITADADPYIRHIPGGLGKTELIRHERAEVLISVYGPECFALAARARDGLELAQNRFLLRKAGIVVQDMGAITPAPAVLHGRWQRKADMRLFIGAEIRREYPILTLIAFPSVGRFEGQSPIREQALTDKEQTWGQEG